ncbi:MAG: 8-oxoguanine deaminase [Armatimonadota bacterium]|nr:8-oxoguanine deaminase [Armatimonadota bacterium]MDR7448115.1 8-oxoguanine deaminase [Armatimonadota bacterium]MDR7459681.1 8-oxoguanine deaminase [Armatimonadota bacterium]MDR7478273.1 8-oxoguanine deaminase [Armatimonadota bacterium]MDR7487284.1 8-oxoguanine deaminase [Armatimonadota bacterium]
MSTLLIDRCEVVVTMDEAGTELPGGSVLVQDGVIAWVGTGPAPAPPEAERVDGRGLVALPGLVNTHHHLYQALTRVRAQDQGLFGWLRALYPVWAGVDAEWAWAAARVGLAELALSGCSTTTDHHYVFPRGGGGILEAAIAAAASLGVRFHPCRGSMDLGASRGGLPPDGLVEDADTVLHHTEEVIRRHHDPRPAAMLRIAVAPCSPFSVTPRLMRDAADLARRLGIRLHTHIAETRDEEAYCLETFGRRPVELLEEMGWLGPDVWLAHAVHLDGGDIQRLARTQTAVAWCPTSNLRLGSGIAPAAALLRAGVTVGLAVDGSASNDSGHLLAEARMGLLASRVHGAATLGAREVLRAAARGGALCLGRPELGSLVPGQQADVALFSVEGVEFAGAEADPVAALLFCTPRRVRHLLVAGQWVVRDGRLVRADEEEIAVEGRRVARQILAWSERTVAG